MKLISSSDVLKQIALDKQRSLSTDDLVVFLERGELKSLVRLPFTNENGTGIYYLPLSEARVVEDMDGVIKSNIESVSSKITDVLSANSDGLVSISSHYYRKLHEITGCIETWDIDVPNTLNRISGFGNRPEPYLSVAPYILLYSEEIRPPLTRAKFIKLKLTFDDIVTPEVSGQSEIYLQIVFEREEVDRFVRSLEPGTRSKDKTSAQIKMEQRYIVYERWLEKKSIKSHRESGCYQKEVWGELSVMSKDLFTPLTGFQDSKMKRFFEYVSNKKNS